MSSGAGPQMSKYPNGFTNGVSVRGVPLLQTHPGQVFWLGNGTALPNGGVGGADGNDGTFYRPLATLAEAFDRCVANRGDVIMVKPGHAESIASASALTLNKAGVAVVGLGVGAARPTFTLTTATTATINVSANNISIQNCMFTSAFLNVAALFTLTTATWFCVEACDIYDTSTILNILKVVQTSTTDQAADGLTLIRNRISLTAASGAQMLVSVNGNLVWLTVANNHYMALTTGTGAVIPIAAGKLLYAAQILDNVFNLVNAAGTATGYLITTNGTTNTGFIDGNRDSVLCTSPLPVTLSSGFKYGLHYHADTADRCGYLVPAADS
jgi:hypothetical protein